MAPKPRDTAEQKPGDGTQVPESNYNYDADEKARARQAGVITIGGEQFHRAKKDWDTSRELQRLMSKQSRAQHKILRIEARQDGLAEQLRGIRDVDTGDWKVEPLQDDDKIAEIETKVDELDEQKATAGEESDQAAYDMIALLLRKKDAPDPDADAARPTDEFLKKELDSAEASDLVGLLTSGSEPPADPTTTGTTSA